jgi:hypothetical protein
MTQAEARFAAHMRSAKPVPYWRYFILAARKFIRALSSPQ